jgi:hypothetical protein
MSKRVTCLDLHIGHFQDHTIPQYDILELQELENDRYTEVKTCHSFRHIKFVV